MVYYSKLADEDLSNIFIGLTIWKKHPLEFNHAANYVDDIVDSCDKLDQSSYHENSQFLEHIEFGEKVYKYIRNKNTTWYIIYDFDVNSNTVYIQHITSNHITKGK